MDNPKMATSFAFVYKKNALQRFARKSFENLHLENSNVRNQMSHEKKQILLALYCFLLNRDPCYGLK